MKYIVKYKNLWRGLFLLFSFLSLFSSLEVYRQGLLRDNERYISIINHRLQLGICFSCSKYLSNLESALEMYCEDHGGRLPTADGPDDYYYWIKGITKKYLAEINLYCPADRSRLAPSSYISDPRLAGRKLSDLKKIPHLVILREREYRHPDGKAAFCGSDFCGMYSKDKLPPDLKYDPNLPEREKVTYQGWWIYYPAQIWGIVFLICLGSMIAFYILWGLSRRPRERGR